MRLLLDEEGTKLDTNYNVFHHAESFDFYYKNYKNYKRFKFIL